MNKAGIIKHKAVFDAWLEGAEIQYKVQGANAWHDFVANSTYPEPLWLVSLEYRVKPTIVQAQPYRRYIYSYDNNYFIGIITFSSYPSSEDINSLEELDSFANWIDNDWITSELKV